MRSEETNLGDWIADANKDYCNCDIGMVNGGGIRGNSVIPAGPITRRTLSNIHPFGNQLVTVKVTKAQLTTVLEAGASRLPNGGFCQISGIK